MSSGKNTEQLIYGIRPVIEAVRSGKEFERIFVKKGLNGTLFNELRDCLKEQQLAIKYVPVEKLNRLTRKNHQGVVAVTSLITYANIENLVPGIFEKGQDPLIIILDKLTDVRNLGAIARTALCSEVHCIIVPETGSATINSDAIKASAGALYKTPVCKVKDVGKTIGFLKNSGLQIVSCTEKTDKMMYDVDLTLPTAIILGSEYDGITNEYLKLSDNFAKIPILGDVGSLNVSVSAGIIIYEAIRQRRYVSSRL